MIAFCLITFHLRVFCFGLKIEALTHGIKNWITNKNNFKSSSVDNPELDRGCTKNLKMLLESPVQIKMV